MQLSVLTYNIHGGVGMDGVLDLERLADVVAGSGAELVALQEVDSWALVGDGEGHTFEAELPPRRIDYLWVGGDLRPLTARVLSSPASDHAALLVTVEVSTPGL